MKRYGRRRAGRRPCWENTWVLQADQARRPKALRGNTRGDTKCGEREQHQEKSRERVDAQMKRQIGSPSGSVSACGGHRCRPNAASARRQGERKAFASRRMVVGDSPRRRPRAKPTVTTSEPARGDEGRPLLFTLIGWGVGGQRKTHPVRPRTRKTCPRKANFILRGRDSRTMMGDGLRASRIVRRLEPAKTVRVPCGVERKLQELVGRRARL